MKAEIIAGLIMVIVIQGVVILKLDKPEPAPIVQQPYIYIDCNSYEMEAIFERMAEIEAYVAPVEG